MSKKDSWLSCEACESEFKVFSSSDDDVSFCPYCGYELETLAEDWNLADLEDVIEE